MEIVAQSINNTLCIDVGDNTGYAYWKDNQLALYGQFSTKENDRLDNYIREMSENFSDLIEHVRSEIHGEIDLCILEGVELWGGSLRSITSAKRGNLFKLAYLVGVYSNVCYAHDIPFRIVLARAWKGQMSDDVVARKVRFLTGITFKKSRQHTADAIGIGFSMMGYFERTCRHPQRTKRFKRDQA